MPCTWNRWRISKALDTDEPLSPSLERHMQGCDSCREFFRFGSSLPQKSQTDLNTLLSEDREDLDGRILTHLDLAPTDRTGGKNRFPLLVPAVSAALAMAVLVLGFVFFRPSPAADLSQLNPLSEWERAEAGLSSLVVSMDSPYITELENLRSSLSATAEFFRGFLDIRLGEEE